MYGMRVQWWQDLGQVAAAVTVPVMGCLWSRVSRRRRRPWGGSRMWGVLTFPRWSRSRFGQALGVHDACRAYHLCVFDFSGLVGNVAAWDQLLQFGAQAKQADASTWSGCSLSTQPRCQSELPHSESRLLTHVWRSCWRRVWMQSSQFWKCVVSDIAASRLPDDAQRRSDCCCGLLIRREDEHN